MQVIGKSDLLFSPSLDELRLLREGQPVTVLAGPNNSGKSLVLKWMKALLGRATYMVGTNRFYHVYHLSTGLRDPRELDQWESQFAQNFWQEQYNYEQNYIDLNRIIMGLSNLRRQMLFDLCSQLIGNRFSLLKVDPDNDLSPRYIDMDGQNLAVSSTGTRLLMTMLGICMDERFNTILIDEPELGLGPRIQQTFAEFISDGEQRGRYFPHLKHVFLSTHSHLFLDRRDIGNNFVVAKEGNQITLTQVKSLSDFHRLQFNLLGNALEVMFFPSAIVVVEGKTDHLFLERLIQLRFPGRRVTVLAASGDVKRKVAGLREAFGDIRKSPYRDRLFVVLDEIHQPGLRAELEEMGVNPNHVVVWSRNGIEYLYPRELLCEIFAAGQAEVGRLTILGDRVRVGDISRTKTDLCAEITKRLNSTTQLDPELYSALLDKVDRAIQ